MQAMGEKYVETSSRPMAAESCVDRTWDPSPDTPTTRRMLALASGSHPDLVGLDVRVPTPSHQRPRGSMLDPGRGPSRIAPRGSDEGGTCPRVLRAAGDP